MTMPGRQYIEVRKPAPKEYKHLPHACEIFKIIS